MTADGVLGKVSHRISIIKKYNKGCHYSRDIYVCCIFKCWPATIPLQPDKWLQMVCKVKTAMRGWELAKCECDLAKCGWDLTVCGWDLAECLTANAYPGSDPSILWQRGIWGAAEEAVLNKVLKKEVVCYRIKILKKHNKVVIIRKSIYCTYVEFLTLICCKLSSA